MHGTIGATRQVSLCFAVWGGRCCVWRWVGCVSAESFDDVPEVVMKRGLQIPKLLTALLNERQARV